MRRKILAVLLACMLVLSLVPMTVFAQTGACERHTANNEPCVSNYTFYAHNAGVCGEYSYDLFLCGDCGELFASHFVLNDNSCEWEETAAAVAPTCTEDGTTAVYTCTVCGEVKGGDVDPAIDHAWVADAEATGACDETIPYHCSRCDATKEDSAENHTWSNDPVAILDEEAAGEEYVEAIQIGWALYECVDCDATKLVRVLCDCDNIGWSRETAPTCTENGYIKYGICDICDTVYNENNEIISIDDVVVPATGHTAGQLPADAVCGENVDILCTVCGEAASIAVGEHNFVNASYDPTCTAFGGEGKVCSKCGESKDFVVTPPLGHTPYEKVAEAGTFTSLTNPTCETAGFATWACESCGVTCEQEIAPAGHYGVEVVVAATCATKAYTYTYCANATICDGEAVETYEFEGATYGVTVEGAAVVVLAFAVTGDIDAEAHNWIYDASEGNLNPPTCTTAGDGFSICSYCGDFTWGEVEALGHDFTIQVVVTQEATCELPELSTMMCSRCDATEEDVQTGDALGHDLGDEIVVNATCVADGYSYQVCSRCTGEFTVEGSETTYVAPEHGYYASVEEAEEAGHVGVSSAMQEIFVAGDCLNTGIYKYLCPTCNRYVGVVVEGTGEGHQNDEVYDAEGEVAPVAPTCTEDGVEGVYLCTICNTLVNMGNKTATTGHTEEEIPAVDADCTNAGSTAGVKCSVCNETLVAPETVDALEHDLVDVDAVDATCQAAGHQAGKVCTREGCDYTEGLEEIAQLTCTKDVYVIAGQRVADCTLFGYTLHVAACDSCGAFDEYIDNYVVALGHTEETVDAVEATCTSNGTSEYVKCSVCDEILVAPRTSLANHKNAAGEILVDDCLSTVEDRVCVYCTETIGQTHANLQETWVPATCKDYGYYLEYCDRCDMNRVTGIVDDYLEKHTMGDWQVETPATFTSVGVERSTCAVCGYSETREYTVSGMKYTMDIDNAVKSGAGYSDSSLIAVTVSVESFAGVDVWGLAFDVVYDDAILNFVKAELVSDVFVDKYMVNDNGGYVSIAANVADILVDGVKYAQSYEVTADKHEFVTLYFRVAPTVEVDGEEVRGAIEALTEVEFSFDDQEAYDTDLNAIAFEGEAESIEILPFMDVTRNGAVAYNDVLVAYQIALGQQGELVYDVTVDVDKNGVVDFADIYALYEYEVGVKNYEDMVNLGVDD